MNATCEKVLPVANYSATEFMEAVAPSKQYEGYMLKKEAGTVAFHSSSVADSVLGLSSSRRVTKCLEKMVVSPLPFKTPLLPPKDSECLHLSLISLREQRYLPLWPNWKASWDCKSSHHTVVINPFHSEMTRISSGCFNQKSPVKEDIRIVIPFL